MKIDIIHATAGEGHRKIALSIQEAFLRAGRNDLDIRVINSLDHVSPMYKTTYSQSYYWSVTNAPAVWGFCYEALDNEFVYSLARPFRALSNDMNCRPLLETVLSRRPDVVISTHFMAPEILGRAKLRGRLNAKLMTVITDFYPHTFWVNPGTDHYWVMADETKQDLLRRKVPAERITVGGIPISAAFKPKGKKAALVMKHGLEPGKFTLLLTSGSFGTGPQEAILEELKAFADKVQCFVVCGNNKDLKARLDARTYPFPVKVFGFIDFMPELMEASDLMIAKSGGSTTTESFAEGVIMVVMHPIPGQETRNARLLKLRNASFFLEDPKEIRGIMDRVFSERETMAEKRAAVDALARPDAADALVKMVLGGKS